MIKELDIFVNNKSDMNLVLAIIESTINGMKLVYSEFIESTNSVRMRFTADTEEKCISNDMSLLGFMTHYRGIVESF